jgi:histidyl-tRNA synthetase
MLAQALREAGKVGELAFAAKSMKAQMRQASRKNARKVLILGGDELATSTVVVKDMASGEQVSVPMAEIVEHI